MNQKIINIFLTGFILYGMVLTYHFYKKSTYFDKRAEFIRDLDPNFSSDSTLVIASDLLQNADIQRRLEMSEFNIEVYQGDSLLYWNKTAPINKVEGNISKTFKRNGLVYNFNLNDDRQKLYTEPYVDFLLLSLFLIGLALFYLSLHLVQDQFQIFASTNKIHKIIYVIAAFFIYLIPGYYAGGHIFQNSKIFTTANAGFNFSIWLFGLNLIAIAFVFVHLTSTVVKKIVHRFPNFTSYFGGSFMLSSFIYYIVAASEFFVHHELIDIHLSEAINFGYEELAFYIIVSLHLFLFVYGARQWFNSSGLNFKTWEKSIYFIAGILFASLIFIALGFTTNTIGLVLFLMILFLLLDLYFEFFDISISFLLSAVIVFSLFLAGMLYSITQSQNLERINYSMSSLYKNISESDLTKLKAVNQNIINSELFPSLSNLQNPQNLDVKDIKSYISSQIKDSKNLNIEAIYCYDKNGNSLALNQISNRIKIQNLITESEVFDEHIYYSPIEKEAILHYNIDNNHDATNPLFFSLLFIIKNQESNKLPYKSGVAIYKGNNLIKTIGEGEFAPYPGLLDQINTQDYKKVKKLVVKDYTFINAESKSFLSKFLPLFTLFITISGLLLLLLIVLNSVFHFIDDRHHLSFNTQKSLRSRFQTTIIGLVLFSFILIGGTTAYFYNKLYQLKNSQNFSSLLNTLIKDIQNDISNLEDARNDSRLEKTFRRLESIHPLPLSFYLSSGERMLISENYSDAPQRLLKSFAARELQSNKENNLRILSTVYDDNKVVIPVYDSSNNVTGYFLTKNENRLQNYSGLFDFLSTLLTICVFLFLSALAMSMIITNPMTNSLRNLASRLKSFKLGKDNEALEWKKPDEIGSLITNFNKLQVELNQSADLLSKTQRDLAWREMAKQVAHEIKNPLTPMKLSIQHMQQASGNDPDKMQSMIKRTSATILEQIENLTQIADEFASFGTLPKASNDTIVLNEVVEHIHDLFRKREDMDVQMLEPMYDIYVFADKNQLVRILNNIVKNATQSIPETRRGKIDIELNQNDHFATIRVSDNGVGIPEIMKEKVFTPNFTTKSSGTGLGLAISANMIDSMNGKIYFRSPNERGGTDFFIELPLVRTGEFDSEDLSLE